MKDDFGSQAFTVVRQEICKSPLGYALVNNYRVSMSLRGAAINTRRAVFIVKREDGFGFIGEGRGAVVRRPAFAPGAARFADSRCGPPQ